MQYVIMDLEWNNAYSKKLGRYLNEIIEIGAVKLDKNLRQTDTFSVVIRSQLTKKLHCRVRELTNITNEELDSGIPFTQAMSEFRKWIKNGDTVILTWGDSDVRVMLDNYKYFSGADTIPFLKKYADLQRYIQNILHLPTTQQIGLSAAAELMGIDESVYSLHRALGDSVLSADCFIAAFDKKLFSEYIKECNAEFYARLNHKARVISNIDSPLVDRNEMQCFCEVCGNNMDQIDDWKFVNQSFRAFFYCKSCQRKVRFNVRFKNYFDRVEVRKSSSLVVEPPKEPVEAIS